MTRLKRRVGFGNWLLAVATILVAIVVPALAYTLIDREFAGTVPALQLLVAAAYALTASMVLLEARAAMGVREEPPAADPEDAEMLAGLPTLTAIVSAYLPNEQELVVETIVHLATELRVAPGALQIILAYNTPDDMPDLEGILESLAALNVSFTALRVVSSHSKAENVNAALAHIRGEVTLLLDADHRPARDAAARALRWFAAGYDIVQGRCVIREHDRNWLARIVAIEFEQIYAVAHAGRSLAFDTAMFGGTNGWWRTSVLRKIRMDEGMLTEDIDSSVRALLSGHRLVHDRSIISTELAPPTAKAWWGQRTRWAQGWFQVMLKHQGSVIRSPRLSGELKLYWTYLLGWRELFPLLSLQIFALLLADVFLGRRIILFSNPFLVVTTVLTVIAGPLAALATYRVALAGQRSEMRRWFFIFAAGSLVYTTIKNTVAMAATVRELIGQRSWIVTSRSAPVLVVLVVGVLAAAGAPGAQARSWEAATVPIAPLASSMTLTGRAPVTVVSIPVPNEWTTVGGTLHLRWQASPWMTPNSSLAVRIDGALSAATPLHGGVGHLDVRIPNHAPVGHRLTIELDGQFHTRIDTQCCIPDAATLASLVLAPGGSTVTLSGTRGSAPPLLADLPASLVDLLGTHPTPLYLALPATPTGADVRAAAVIAGAVARSTGSVTVPIRVLLGARASAVLGLPGEVVQVDPAGLPRASVRRRPDGRLTVVLGGKGAGVVTAAWALAGRAREFLTGSTALITGGLDIARPPAVTTAKIAPVAAQGTGPADLAAGFRLPETELTSGKAGLQLDIGFSAPAGGHVDVLLNAEPLVSRDLPTDGSSQLRIHTNLIEDPVYALAHNDPIANLTPGDNFITIRTDLPAGQPVGGSGDALAPSIEVLPTSRVTFATRSRVGPPTLDLWPWPYGAAPAMAGTTFVVPAGATAGELASTIATIAEASRWAATPLAPRIAIGPRALPAGDLVILARPNLTAPAAAPWALPRGAPARARDGLLETYAQGGRSVLVAYGVRALRALTSNYYVEKVRGSAALIAPGGAATTLVAAPAPAAFAAPGLPWKAPAAILVVLVIVLVGLRLRKARRRLTEPPALETVPAADDEARARAQLEEWERLVAEDSNGQPHDHHPTRA